ncbi:uncharacterized protein [Magallana gigas]|uniref:uncharacterized protein n=1 Tax=Magallana gigas TaxID=29159 RepID=UPI0005C3C0D1|nr:uncharacterized protein LOC105326804 [Crassostrea gigas]|eukprot:XP_011425285.1 PREDICTED: uncharacterized protein LOC105326804 [Crassostrea gigas]
MKMKLPICLVMLSIHNLIVVSGQTCDMLTSGIQRCYASIGIKLPQEDIKSILSVPLDYIDTCGMDYSEFFLCYESIIMMCPDYNSLNPLMMSTRSLRSMMFGICETSETYLAGLKCAEEKSDKFHQYTANCFGLRHFSAAVDAVASKNWTIFCENLNNEISCVETVLNAFECGDGFLEVTKTFLYTAQPLNCMDDSSYWDWVRKYGGNEGSVLRLSWISLMLCFIFNFTL